MVKKHDNYLTSKEAAEILGVSAIRVRQFAASKRIPSQRFGINLVFDSADVKKFAKIPRKTGSPGKKQK